MTKKQTTLHNLVQAVLIAGGLFILSAVFFPMLPIMPNYALVALITGAFFLNEIIVYCLYALLILVWLKYVPVMSLEMLYLILTACAAFLAVRLFIFKRSFVIGIIFLACFQTIFWLLFYGAAAFSTAYFYLEFFYNCVLLLALYAAHALISSSIPGGKE